MSTTTPTTSAKTHFDLLHEVKFTTRLDLPEECPECGEKTSGGVSTYEPACGRIDWDENGEVCDTDVPEFFDEVVHEVHCRDCRHVFGEGVTTMITEVVAADDAEKLAAQLKVAPEMLAEHKRTLGQLERMQSMTSHLAKTDPLAEEIAAAIKGTKAIIAKAEGGE